jgi:serine/threonine-protein kinase
MTDAPISTDSSATEPGYDPLIGRVIAGKYSVDQRLGEGAMGVVYRARQLALDRTVALKVLHRELNADDGFAERFSGEARAASRLDHPSSIRVIDFGQEPDGLLYLVMEYVEGLDLFELIMERGPLKPAQIVTVLSQVLAALAVAHDMAVVHRDLKPDNIMIVRGKSDDGQTIDVVKVCDFGIAKILDAPAPDRGSRRKRGSTGIVVGTPAYMSPEQARGEKLDARSDLYSVGIVLYELLTGAVPFDGDSVISVALKHVSEIPIPPSSVVPGVDPDLEAICLRALSKKPAERFQNAREMRLALQAAANKPSLGSQPSRILESRPPAAHATRYDSSKPTLAGVAPPTPASRAKRSRAWLAILALPVAAAWALLHFHSPVPVPREGKELASGESLPLPPLGQREPADDAGDEVAQAPSTSPVSSLGSSPTAGTHAAPGALRRRVRGERAQGAPAARDGAMSVGAAASLVAALPVSEPIAVPAAPTPMPASTPTPVTVTAAATTAPPAPAPVPAAPAYDLQTAHVAIGSTRNVVGATPASVTRAVAEASSRITMCYRAALPQLSGVLEGEGMLHIDTDGAGVITEARLSSALRGGVSSCVAAAVQGHRVANVDTGSASGDVPLSFRAH